ncbi:MAG TPA: TRL-like family protein [Victivallales bacterium]|nr:TRL-like family protein [Victivallales bacterium]HPO89977.1 TRL-like family protein [Victivallales bacterium]HRR05821.1 TRL-like family protein [Victivallales bacterium]HRR28733.1 TRL-like family protein [Victivallales bacterium]
MRKNVEKWLKGTALALTVLAVGGCATAIPQGAIFTDVKLPVSSADGEILYTKSGVSEARSYLGLVAFGDASIEQAVKNGGLKKIKYVDYYANNFLGLIGTYKTTVYGD